MQLSPISHASYDIRPLDTPTMPTGQRAPQSYPPITPSHPFARPSNVANPARAELPRPSYPYVRYQGNVPGSTKPQSTPQRPNWSDINDRRDRLNDIISGTDSARANFTNAFQAWNDGRYTDVFYDGYQGISGTMRALRGGFALAAEGFKKMGYSSDAEFSKNAAAYIITARRALDAVLSPVSSFRDIANVFGDPSSTRQQKLNSIVNYFGGVGQFTGLAILQLDQRAGDTLLKQFGYAMFSLSEAGYATNQIITGYSQAIDALNDGDFKTAGNAALGATINLIEGPQIIANYIADIFHSLGMEKHADKMYEVSARLLNAENTVKFLAAVLNPLLDDSKKK